MVKVFVDASVIFSAFYSSTGFARDLIALGISQKVSLVTSETVLEEVERNVARKAAARLEAYHAFIELPIFQKLPAPTPENVAAATEYVAEKDAHVIAAAIEAQPDYLVTYDRKHLLDQPQVAEKSKLKIVTPDVVVAELKA